MCWLNWKSFVQRLNAVYPMFTAPHFEQENEFLHYSKLQCIIYFLLKWKCNDYKSLQDGKICSILMIVYCCDPLCDCTEISTVSWCVTILWRKKSNYMGSERTRQPIRGESERARNEFLHVGRFRFKNEAGFWIWITSLQKNKGVMDYSDLMLNHESFFLSSIKK